MVSCTYNVVCSLHDRIAHHAYSRHVDGEGDGPGHRLASTLLSARALRGWTQQDLADAARVSRQTIIRYESGKASNPEADPLRRVCHALDLDIRDVLVDLGYVTREELGLPSRPELHPLAIEINRRLLSMSLTDAGRATLERALQRALDSYDEAMKLRAPKEPSAAERLSGLQVDTEAR